MTIEQKSLKREVFEKINSGESFEHDGEICIKTNEVITMLDNRVNAVNLETGELIYLDEGDMVNILNAKVII